MNKTVAIRKITVLAMMTALAVICSGQFPYGLTFRVGSVIKLSPVFVIIGIVAATYGVWEAALVAFLSDLIQSLTAGLGVSPAILLISTLTGLCFGLFLKQGRLSISGIILSVLITQLIGSLLLTTLVLHFRYGVPYFPTIWWRVVQTIIMVFVEIPILKLLLIDADIPNKLKREG